MGLDFGAGHVEMRLGPSGARLIEINRRPAGGWITRLVRDVTGIDIPGEVVRMHLGAQPGRPAPPRAGAAAITFLPAVQGVITVADQIDQARKMPGVTDVQLYVHEGDVQEDLILEHNSGRHGHVIASAATPDEAVRRAATACAVLRVRATTSVADPPEASTRGRGRDRSSLTDGPTSSPNA